LKRLLLIGSITLFALLSVSCNGTTYGVLQPNPEDLCKCIPIEPDILDFHHLAKHAFKLDSQHGGELPQALPVDVLGVAFEDFDHSRGSVHVQTIWELHPAIVTIP